MKRIISTALMLTVFVLASFAQSIVGTWKCTPQTIAAIGFPEGSKVTLLFVFKNDKTCSIDMDISLDQTIDGTLMQMQLKAMFPGAYSATATHLKATFDAKKMTYDVDVSFPGLDDATAKLFKQLMMEQLPDMSQLMIDKIGKSMSDSIEDDYTIKGDILTIDKRVLQRVK